MVFTIYWAWQPSWSCDQAHLYKLLFLWSQNLSHDIWFKITQPFLKKKDLTLKTERPLVILTFDTDVGS